MFWQEKEATGHPHLLEGPFPRPQNEAIPLSEGGVSVPQPDVPWFPGHGCFSGLSIPGHEALTLPFKDSAPNKALLSRERPRWRASSSTQGQPCPVDRVSGSCFEGYYHLLPGRGAWSQDRLRMCPAQRRLSHS